MREGENEQGLGHARQRLCLPTVIRSSSSLLNAHTPATSNFFSQETKDVFHGTAYVEQAILSLS